MWKANNIHGKYCTQTIPMSFNSSTFEKKNHGRFNSIHLGFWFAYKKLKYWTVPFQTLVATNHLYKHVNNNNVSPRNVSTLPWESNFFSVTSWSNNSLFCYVCSMVATWIPTTIFHIIWISSCKFKSLHGCRIHEFLESWWLVVLVAYKWNNRWSLV